MFTGIALLLVNCFSLSYPMRLPLKGVEEEAGTNGRQSLGRADVRTWDTVVANKENEMCVFGTSRLPMLRI